VQLLVLIAVLVVCLLLRSDNRAGSSTSAPSSTIDGDGTSFSDYGPLDALTEAWAHFEGWDQPGSLAQRNNNPVNIKGNWDGVVGHTPAGFAIFSDPSFGWGAAESYVQDQAAKNPTWSLRQLFAKILGSLSGDDVNNDQGNSVAEASYVAGQLGVPSSTNVSTLIGGGES
jgi:hypothetical protein